MSVLCRPFEGLPATFRWSDGLFQVGFPPQKRPLHPSWLGVEPMGSGKAKLKDCKTHQSWVLASQKLLAIPTLRQPLPRILQNNFLLNLPEFDQVVRGGSVKMHCCRKLLKHQFVLFTGWYNTPNLRRMESLPAWQVSGLLSLLIYCQTGFLFGVLSIPKVIERWFIIPTGERHVQK
jgi:hypothetical protein